MWSTEVSSIQLNTETNIATSTASTLPEGSYSVIYSTSPDSLLTSGAPVDLVTGVDLTDVDYAQVTIRTSADQFSNTHWVSLPSILDKAFGAILHFNAGAYMQLNLTSANLVGGTLSFTTPSSAFIIKDVKLVKIKLTY